MVKLSDFLGEIIKDLAAARTYADYNAVAASEIYHADPFIKNLPIPHYIIDEAEIDVPVVVIGISTQSDDYTAKKQLLNDTVLTSLPEILLESFKWNFINERIRRQSNSKETTSGEQQKNYNSIEFTGLQLSAFDECIKEITQITAKKFAKNLSLYNYAVLKLLELSETLGKELKYALKNALRLFKTKREYKNEDVNPFLTKESIDNAVKYVSNIMFFNFKKIVQSDSSVHVEVNTTKMNEYSQKDCMMHIKLKIKEQDLNLIVEEKDDKEIRFLSLT